MDNNAKMFCEELANNFPDLADLLKDHLANYDEILPHVFFGEVTRHVLANSPDRIELVGNLDKSLKERSQSIKDLIAVSFVENLNSTEELEHALDGANAITIRNEWFRQRQYENPDLFECSDSTTSNLRVKKARE